MILGLSCEKLNESEDGSDSDLSDGTKIRTVYLFRPNLAKSTNRSAGLLFKMKRSVRLLLSMILLLAFSGTLACRIVLRRPPAFAALELRSTIMVMPRPPVFNSTLLKFAAIDMGEEKSKGEIAKLLDENFSGLGRHPTWRRFHRDIRTRSTNSLPVTFRSPQFYRYWVDFRSNLRDWSRKKMFQPDIMFDLVRQVKHSIDRNNGLVASDHKYASCAVVGNSGILLNTDNGELIDKHEVVIRLNNARIERFQRNVGSKTTISFVNSNVLHLCARRDGCFCHPYGVNTAIVMYICQPVHIFDYLLCNASHKAVLLITDPRFDTLCARIVKYYSVKMFLEQTGVSLEQWGSTHGGSLFHYSSGMQAVMLALGICDRVSLFGFGKSALAKHHYHTNQKAELPLHDYAAEYAFYHDLMKNPRAIPFMPEKFAFPPVVMYH